MSISFNVPAKTKKKRFTDTVSINDAVTYEINFAPWEEDNSTITSVTWTTEAGSASITGEALTAGVASALITFNQVGTSLISVLADTGTEKKQVWLEVSALDYELTAGDYGVIA